MGLRMSRRNNGYTELKKLAKDIAEYSELTNAEKETLEIAVIARLLDEGKRLYDSVKTAVDPRAAIENYSKIRAYEEALKEFEKSEAGKKEKYKPLIERIEKRYEIAKALNMFYLTLNKEEIKKMQDQFSKLLEEIEKWAG